MSNLDDYIALVIAIGDGFHPDTSGDQYVSLPDGYTPERVDAIVDRARDGYVDLSAVANDVLDAERVKYAADKMRADFGHMRADFASDPGGWLDYSGGYRFADDVTAAAAIALVLGEWCTNPQHDHTTPVDRDGIDLDEPIAMLCNDCGVPTHYDGAIEQYVHDAADAAPCFLIPDRPDGATACEVAR